MFPVGQIKGALTVLVDVVAVLLHLILTESDIFSKDCDIFPLGGMPVWIIISFFRTLITSSSSTRVLSGAGRFVAFHFLVSSEQTWGHK